MKVRKILLKYEFHHYSKSNLFGFNRDYSKLSVKFTLIGLEEDTKTSPELELDIDDQMSQSFSSEKQKRKQNCSFVENKADNSPFPNCNNCHK